MLIQDERRIERAERQKASAWLFEVENSKATCGWTDNITYNIARARSKGNALKWLSSRILEVSNWQTFCVVFKKTFTKGTDFVERVRQMEKRIQGAREPVRAHVIDKI